MTHRFTSTAIYLWSALLTWMGTFVFVYVFAALACARQFAGARVAGMPLVPFVTTLSGIAAGMTTAYLLWTSYRRMRTSTDEHSRFIQFVVSATSILVLVGLLYLALPPLILATHCAGGA